MSAKNFTDWETRTPGLITSPDYAYIKLPAFSTSASSQVPLEPGQPSVIITQWNYNAGRKFTITTIPTDPNGSFVACVRFTVNGTVFRYRLWDDNNESLGHIPLYTGQVIYPYFVIEIWTVDGQTEYPVMLSDMLINTSIRSYATDILTRTGTYELATGAQVANLGVIVPTAPFDYNQLWYPGFGGDVELSGLATAGDVSWPLAKTGTGPTGRSIQDPINPWNAITADFVASVPNPVAGSDSTTQLWDSFYFYFVGKLPTYTPAPLQQWIFALKSDSFANYAAFDIYNTGTPTIQALGTAGIASMNYSDTDPHVFACRFQAASVGIRVDKGDETSQASAHTSWNSASTLTIGESYAGSYPADLTMAALLCYRRSSISEAEHDQLVDYLRYTYLDELPLPTDFAEGNEWTDNVE